MPMFNNYPVTYQNPYYQQYPTQPNAYPTQQGVAQQPMQTNGIIWVQGEAGAKSYLVAPNTTVALWDSESETIYLKSADAIGMPSIKTLDYTIRGNNMTLQAKVIDEEHITRDEFNLLKNEIITIEKEMEKIKMSKKEEEHNG